MTSTVGAMTPRRRAAARRSWWADGLNAAMWFAASGGVAFWIADGGLNRVSGYDWLYGMGQALGIVTAVAMMTQVLLASRAPWIERALGHDRAIAKHTFVGKVAILLMAAHLTFLTVPMASWGGESFLESYLSLGQSSVWFAGATIAGTLFVIILITSLTAHLRRWHYESWHLVHRLVYVAIAFAVPHQFLEGATFVNGGPAFWYWLALYVVAFGSFIAYRVVRPVWLWVRHAPRVSAVTLNPDGSTTVEVAGRDLHRLRARAGQFFLWRFHTPRLFWQKHPYSLSGAPRDGKLRITVKPLGRGSAAVAGIRPGTRVGLEGPLGLFTHEARVGSGLVLVAAGIGVTPIRAMLEEVESGDECTVIIRSASRDEAPLMAEVEALAARNGATVHHIVGPRGEGWGSSTQPATLAALVARVSDADVFICGPIAWARAVESDALASGVPPTAIHRERFGW